VVHGLDEEESESEQSTEHKQPSNYTGRKYSVEFSSKYNLGDLWYD
jgi:hypothetical protein